MLDVPKRHQLAIAKKTLRMTPIMARIMGGIAFADAYEIVFREPLRLRLLRLVAEYPDRTDLNWELTTYGWHDPAELLKLL